MTSLHCSLGAAAGASLLLFAFAAGAAPVQLDVDARDTARGIERAHLTLPVKPGKLTLLYPKWLPGEHAPDGPIAGVSSLRFSVNGQDIAWRRDDENMYAFHVSVPSGATSLDVSFEVTASTGAALPNATRTATESLSIILWNQLVMYPAGAQSDDLRIRARLRLPSGWAFGTALPRAGTAAGDATQFEETSLTTLIDSPVLAGRHFKTVELGGTPAVYLHLAADSEAALLIPPATAEQYRKLVREATALFGATHYGEYHFLWALSDLLGYEGIEHHQSSDNRSAERSLIDDDLRRSSLNTLLPHEYAHSWNGKYRRPAGLATGNYDRPMRGELLWVYEGLTEYLGQVLSARAGLQTPEEARIQWADIAAWAQSHKGREWRSLSDTAIAAQIGYFQSADWMARTRGVDYYDESALLWLEADTLIRSRSNGTKSLDDFCRLFYGPPSTAPKVVPYEFDDVVKALNTVLPYDWREFWTERVEHIQPQAPLRGLAAGGWHLDFSDQASAVQRGNFSLGKYASLAYSLGFKVRDENAILFDVIPGSPADVAGIAPGAGIVAINGRRYSKDILGDVLGAERDEAHPLELLLVKDDLFSTVPVRYAGKARYPKLERDAGKPDVLGVILGGKT